MSDNTKASKIDRILVRQGEAHDRELVAHDLLQTIFRQQATVDLLTKTAHSLEAENQRLRKYLGSILFARRRLQALELPTLEPKWGNYR